MEHRLILGGEQYLPFARSCITKLKKLGLPYANQSFDIDGVSVKVRIEPGHEYIALSGGGSLLGWKLRPMAGYYPDGIAPFGWVADPESEPGTKPAQIPLTLEMLEAPDDPLIDDSKRTNSSVFVRASGSVQEETRVIGGSYFWTDGKGQRLLFGAGPSYQQTPFFATTADGDDVREVKVSGGAISKKQVILVESDEHDNSTKFYCAPLARLKKPGGNGAVNGLVLIGTAPAAAYPVRWRFSADGLKAIALESNDIAAEMVGSFGGFVESEFCEYTDGLANSFKGVQHIHRAVFTPVTDPNRKPEDSAFTVSFSKETRGNALLKSVPTATFVMGDAIRDYSESPPYCRNISFDLCFRATHTPGPCNYSAAYFDGGEQRLHAGLLAFIPESPTIAPAYVGQWNGFVHDWPTSVWRPQWVDIQGPLTGPLTQCVEYTYQYFYVDPKEEKTFMGLPDERWKWWDTMPVPSPSAPTPDADGNLVMPFDVTLTPSPDEDNYGVYGGYGATNSVLIPQSVEVEKLVYESTEVVVHDAFLYLKASIDGTPESPASFAPGIQGLPTEVLEMIQAVGDYAGRVVRGVGGKLSLPAGETSYQIPFGARMSDAIASQTSISYARWTTSQPAKPIADYYANIGELFVNYAFPFLEKRTVGWQRSTTVHYEGIRAVAVGYGPDGGESILELRGRPDKITCLTNEKTYPADPQMTDGVATNEMNYEYAVSGSCGYDLVLDDAVLASHVISATASRTDVVKKYEAGQVTKTVKETSVVTENAFVVAGYDLACGLVLTQESSRTYTDEYGYDGDPADPKRPNRASGSDATAIHSSGGKKQLFSVQHAARNTRLNRGIGEGTTFLQLVTGFREGARVARGYAPISGVQFVAEDFSELGPGLPAYAKFAVLFGRDPSIEPGQRWFSNPSPSLTNNAWLTREVVVPSAGPKYPGFDVVEAALYALSSKKWLVVTRQAQKDDGGPPEQGVFHDGKSLASKFAYMDAGTAMFGTIEVVA